jgi:hypothetical protein
MIGVGDWIGCGQVEVLALVRTADDHDETIMMIVSLSMARIAGMAISAYFLTPFHEIPFGSFAIS